MNPKFCKRFTLSGSSFANHYPSSLPGLPIPKTSVRDEAALLLSIADIAKSEIGANGGFSALWKDDEDLPMFPLLTSPPSKLVPPTRSQRNANHQSCTNTKRQIPTFTERGTQLRFRSVSIDGTTTTAPEVEAIAPPLSSTTAPLVGMIPLPLEANRTVSPLTSMAAASSETSTPTTSGEGLTLVTPVQSPSTSVKPIAHRRLPLRKQIPRSSSSASSNGATTAIHKKCLLQRTRQKQIRQRQQLLLAVQESALEATTTGLNGGRRGAAKGTHSDDDADIDQDTDSMVSNSSGEDIMQCDDHHSGNGKGGASRSSTKSTQPPEASKALQKECPKGVVIKKILRRKFSWKNYPELEQFLIVNREEYLRHSALNYTVQQKQYNNRLTERLLELATEHGYVFDQSEFGFVTVRDRIRCYYKSFVQSAKKRGILMGYAARKAGLLNDDGIEEKTTAAGVVGRSNKNS